MKHIFNIAAVTLVATLSVGAAQAAGVSNQTDIIKSKLTVGDYQALSGSSAVQRIAEIQPDKAQLYGHLHIVVQPYPNDPSDQTRNTRVDYFADNVAFPVTYRRTVYEGNAKLQEKVGYTLRRGPSVNKRRLVVVDDYVFLLREWKNKDDYKVGAVLKIGSDNTIGSRSSTTGLKKGVGRFLGALAKSMGQVVAGKTGGGGNIANLKNTVLQPYLDQATAQQQHYYAAWKKKRANAKHLKYLDDMDAAMADGMRNYNRKIYNSPAHQRMLAHRKWMAKNVDVEVQNNTGSTVWVGSQDSPYYSGIPSGTSSTRDCTNDLYVHYSQGSKSGTKFYSARSACGSKVSIR